MSHPSQFIKAVLLGNILQEVVVVVLRQCYRGVRFLFLQHLVRKIIRRTCHFQRRLTHRSNHIRHSLPFEDHPDSFPLLRLRFRYLSISRTSPSRNTPIHILRRQPVLHLRRPVLH